MEVMNDVICHSISIEWQALMRTFRVSLRNRCRGLMRNKRHRLGSERIGIDNMVYKRIFVCLMASLVMLGTSFLKLTINELKYKTKTSSIILILSKERMRILASHFHLCLSRTEHRSLLCCYGGKSYSWMNHFKR
mmetsp:Transcript_14773/g.21100  ORF Transcript_14773/g.21100 Transcript_14773/m.21100 type:complete len:135 (+) Transcript_14773:423-827(+)